MNFLHPDKVTVGLIAAMTTFEAALVRAFPLAKINVHSDWNEPGQGGHVTERDGEGHHVLNLTALLGDDALDGERYRVGRIDVARKDERRDDRRSGGMFARRTRGTTRGGDGE